MHALTAGGKDRSGKVAAFHAERSLVLPRMLRRPARSAHRLMTGAIAVPRHAGNLLSAAFIGGCALYFRFRLTDPRLRPGRLWDIGLCLSCLSLLVAGLFSLYQVLQ